MTGTIKSFSPQRGYGFIAVTNHDVYFHNKDWLDNDKPRAGQQVEFLLKRTDKGYRGFRVRRVKNGK